MEEVRKLGKNTQGTYRISLPKDVIKNLKWKERQKLVVRQVGKKIIIEDWKPRIS